MDVQMDHSNAWSLTLAVIWQLNWEHCQRTFPRPLHVFWLRRVWQLDFERENLEGEHSKRHRRKLVLPMKQPQKYRIPGTRKSLRPVSIQRTGTGLDFASQFEQQRRICSHFQCTSIWYIWYIGGISISLEVVQKEWLRAGLCSYLDFYSLLILSKFLNPTLSCLVIIYEMVMIWYLAYRVVENYR